MDKTRQGPGKNKWVNLANRQAIPPTVRLFNQMLFNTQKNLWENCQGFAHVNESGSVHWVNEKGQSNGICAQFETLEKAIDCLTSAGWSFHKETNLNGVYVRTLAKTNPVKVLISGKPKTLAQAKVFLSPLGITIRKTVYGEYLVRIKGSPNGEGYFTDDLADAVGTGQLMAERKTSPILNLGIETAPIGWRSV